LTGGETTAPAAQPPQPSQSTAPAGPRPVAPEPGQGIPPRKPAAGKAWIEFGLSRNDVKNPREIVDLLVEAAGLTPRDVGFIALGDTSSYAEVPADFAKGLSPSGNILDTSRGEILIRPEKLPSKKKRR
ncbi:MAG: DbpA RNA binding domain-containing protein, partial [Chthoniobacterales bacterium]